MKNKIVYAALSADILHSGHINILKRASKFGNLIVGLLTDEAISEYKSLPHLNYKQREIVLSNIKYVKKVIPQKTHDYSENLKKIKPDFVVHGDDWKNGIQSKVRLKVLKVLKSWSGKLIEIPYTKNISSTNIKKKLLKNGITPDIRKEKLSRLIKSKKIVRVIESHNSLTAHLVENCKLNLNNKLFEFDAIWSSSLCDSLIRGKPDDQSVDYSSRILSLRDMTFSTIKPFLFDADNGGELNHLPFLIKSLEQTGVSAIVIEDKIGLKQNSLKANQTKSRQDSIKNFVRKIKVCKKNSISENFLTIARIESLILGKGMKDAIKRANAYSKAGADAILIHSKSKSSDEIFTFAKEFKKSKYYKPLVAVPSTYSKTREDNLIKAGFKVVIYANQLVRSAITSYQSTLLEILKNQRSFEVDKKIFKIKDTLNLF